MKSKKIKAVYYLLIAQLILQVVCLIWGFNFKSDSNVVSSSILGMITKVQCTNNLQNFIWAFTHNLAMMFIIFWLSYFTFGIIGTFWCVNNSFMIGGLAKAYFGIMSSSAWLSILFMVLELIAAMLVTLSSTYFKLERHNFKKAFRNKIDFDEIYKIEKKKHEKSILYVFAAVAIVLLIAAILETIVLSSL